MNENYLKYIIEIKKKLINTRLNHKLNRKTIDEGYMIGVNL